MHIEGHIILPIYEFIPYLVGIKEYSVVNFPLAEQVKAADPTEQFCHVQLPDEHNQLTLPQVWYIKAWKTDYARQLEIKRRSAEERLRSNLRTEKIDEVIKAVLKKLPTLGVPIATTMAREILEKNNVAAAKVFGVEELL